MAAKVEDSELRYYGTVDESYMEGGYHFVYIGQIYNDKYLVLRKLGCGRYSTVWLVVNIHTNHHYAMKVLVAREWTRKLGYGISEMRLLDLLQHSDGHSGKEFLPKLIDGFMVSGVNGKHSCLVFEIMGERISDFAHRFSTDTLPAILVKRVLKQVLLALDHAHKIGAVHCDIHTDSIMVPLMDRDNALKTWLSATTLSEAPPPVDAYKVAPAINLPLRLDVWSDATIFGCKYQVDFSSRHTPPWKHNSGMLKTYHRQDLEMTLDQDIIEDEDVKALNFVLGDWTLALWSPVESPSTSLHHVSSRPHRSPEQCLRAYWTSKTVIWSLGVTVVELLGGFQMFSGEDNNGKYRVTQHLHEMTLLFGPIPSQLREKGNQGASEAWGQPKHLKYLNSEGMVDKERMRETGEEWELLDPNPKDWKFEKPGGPFADDDDGRTNRGGYVAVITNMLQMDPEKRMSAEQLLQLPWLRDVKL